jgi:uncharacterized protein (DUF2147 family)
MPILGRFLRILIGAYIVAALLTISPALASALPSPLGDWTTSNGKGVVEIAPCGDALCGRIVGIDRPPGSAMPTDTQGRSQCGLTIIAGETPTGGGTWLGHITDPRNGTNYQAEIWVDPAGQLHLRGFVGIPLFGETQIWHRFTGQLTPDCSVA